MNAFIQVKIVDTEQGIYGNSYAIDQFLAGKKISFYHRREERRKSKRANEAAHTRMGKERLSSW